MRDKFVLEVFYTNLNLHSAGIEKFIKTQVAALNANGIDAVTLFPVRKTIPLININLWGVMLNNSLMDVKSTGQVVAMLGELYGKGKKLAGVFIQHLMNLDIHGLQTILSSVKNVPVMIYLHDFYTACLQYNLLKNDAEYCKSADLNESKCKECQYYKASVTHKEEINSFFDKLGKNSTLTFIAPSEFVGGLWSDAYPQYKKNVLVLNHLHLLGCYEGNWDTIPASEPLKIAYVGAQSANKGWLFWKNAVEQLNMKTHNYELYHLGYSDYVNPAIKNIAVSVQRDGEYAMVNALRSNGIHVAVLNSNCPETYSYTYYESFASNAFIITNKNSGNIAIQVEKNKNGVIMESSCDIDALLQDENTLRFLVNSYRLSEKKGPLSFENANDYFTLLSKVEDPWYKDIVMPENDNNIMRIAAIILYNSRYGKQGQSFSLKSKKLLAAEDNHA